MFALGLFLHDSCSRICSSGYIQSNEMTLGVSRRSFIYNEDFLVSKRFMIVVCCLLVSIE